MAVPINVCAANQKIKVNPVYQNSKVIKGKTKKRYRVQAKIGKKKYQTKADRKGNFRLRIPKQSVGKSFYIKVYRGKRYILKKKIHVLTKSIKVQKFSIKNKINNLIYTNMRKLFGIIAMAAIAAVAGWNFSQSLNEVVLSDQLMSKH